MLFSNVLQSFAVFKNQRKFNRTPNFYKDSTLIQKNIFTCLSAH